MVDNEQRRDELLAGLTDHLLGGQAIDDPGVPAEMEREMRAVQILRQIMGPDEPIRPVFRESLTRRLNEEWNIQERRRGQKKSRIIPFSQQRSRLVAVAAMIAIVSVAVLVIAGDGFVDSGGTGTAVGPLVLFVILLILGAVTALGFYIWGRRQ